MRGLVELFDRLSCCIVLFEVDERVLVLHHDVSDLAAFPEEVLEVVCSCAAGYSSDVNLSKVGVVCRLCPSRASARLSVALSGSVS